MTRWRPSRDETPKPLFTMRDMRVVVETESAVLVRPEEAPRWDGDGVENKDEWAQWVPKKVLVGADEVEKDWVGVIALPQWFTQTEAVRPWVQKITTWRIEEAEKARRLLQMEEMDRKAEQRGAAIEEQAKKQMAWVLNGQARVSEPVKTTGGLAGAIGESALAARVARLEEELVSVRREYNALVGMVVELTKGLKGKQVVSQAVGAIAAEIDVDLSS